MENYGYADKIWPLKGEIRNDSGEPPNVNRGWTYIRGQTYKVSEDDTKLEPVTGSQEYEINYKVQSNNYESKYVIQVLVPIVSGTTKTWMFKYLNKASFASIGGDLTDDISKAHQFQDETTANSWIEGWFGG